MTWSYPLQSHKSQYETENDWRRVNVKEKINCNEMKTFNEKIKQNHMEYIIHKNVIKESKQIGRKGHGSECPT